MSGQAEITVSLNPRQLEAVTYSEGPLLVLAGAGSGKTRVLTCRVAYLLDCGRCAPEQILAVTFTNKAAGEMKERIEELTGVASTRMQVSTFHSFTAKLLRQFGNRIGIRNSFTIYDEEDALSLIKASITELGFDIKKLTPRLVRSRISDAKSELVDVKEYHKLAGDFITERIARVYDLYQQKLSSSLALDFDDLLFQAVRLLQSDSEILKRVQMKYRYLLIDEYQDTNNAQYVLAKLLSAIHKNIFAVGDDDQSIYGWRGANVNNILNFEKDFPSCKIIRMEQNYRSTQTILKAASVVIENNKRRKGKTLFSVGDIGEPLLLLVTQNDHQEAKLVTDYVESHIASGIPRHEIGILYRTNAQSRALEESLKRRYVPYKIVGGLHFYQRKEIKDLLAYVKLLDNDNDDVSFKRIINYPKRGIGLATLSKLETEARETSCSLLELISGRSDLNMLSETVKGKIERFSKLIHDLKEKSTEMLLEALIRTVAEQSGIIDDLNTLESTEAKTRLENIDELIASAGEFQASNRDAGLRDFLQGISLYTDIDNYDIHNDSVTLMTLHAAKGLEFESVFITGLEDGLFPLSRNIDDRDQLEEERRLMYVGMTRAKKKLTLSYAHVRARFGKNRTIRSRFVDELPDEVLNVVQHTILDEYGHVNTSYVEPEFFDTDDPYNSIRVGSIVYHPRFGEGRVEWRAGTGESTEFIVRFTYAGPKKLRAKYARLRLVR